jgi:hypothetical protein
LLLIGLVGCEEKKTTDRSEMKISTPGGETTIRIERDVKKTGDDPPPERPRRIRVD